ncbi:MAG: PASTA domain-containing protein, partial [Desulfobacula sp.]|nr:PASTA domain-containing protein [Desulfobacula sp.]
MKKSVTLNISIITRQLLFLFILFFGFTYANASNNANQISKSSYDATNLRAAFAVLKMRIESERESLKNISIACKEIDTRKQIEKMVEELEKQYNKHSLLSNSINEILRKDQRDMLQLDIIRSELAEIKRSSSNNANIVCKASKEKSLDLVAVKKAAGETQRAAQIAKELLSRMKEISGELYDSLSDGQLFSIHFKDSESNIYRGPGESKSKCYESGISFDRQVLLGMIPEQHLEIKKRYKQAGKLLDEAKTNNYKHANIYQVIYDNYEYFVKEKTTLHNSYYSCKVSHSYLSNKCQELYDKLAPKEKEKYIEHKKLEIGLLALRNEQLTRLKDGVKNMAKDAAMIYTTALDAEECMGNIDLNETIYTEPIEDPPVSSELCTCSGGTIEIGPYKNESDCLKDQKIWPDDRVTWSKKNGGTCYRCPEEDVRCEKQPVYVSGTIWDVWGPIPYGYGTVCLTNDEVSDRMKPGAKKDKDGWLGRNGGGTMRPTGKSCSKLADGRNTSGGSDLDPDKPKNIDPNDPKTAAIIKEWVGSAEPPINATGGANARFEPYGRVVGEIIGGIGKVTGNPDDTAGRTPEKYAWDKRNKLDSVDHCTLGEYVTAKLGNKSIDHCKGRYKPKVSDVIGMKSKQAGKKLKGLGLKTKISLGSPALTKKDSLTVEKTIPNIGSIIERGAAVTIVVHPPFVDVRTVPELKGLTEKELIKKIKDAGLVPKVKRVKALSSKQSGKAGNINPQPGTEVVAGTTILVDVFDTFDDKVVVPNVIGLSIKEAAKKIKDTGLKPIFKLSGKTNDHSKDKTITKQAPKAGTKIAYGSKMEMFVLTYGGIKWSGINGDWSHSNGTIEVTFKNESSGYYTKLGQLKNYNFRVGELGFKVKKTEHDTYHMDIKYRYKNKNSKPYWVKSHLKIIDNNTMKDGNGTIWKRILGSGTSSDYNNTTIFVDTVDSFGNGKSVPNVIGFSIKKAAKAIKAAGFKPA